MTTPQTTPELLAREKFEAWAPTQGFENLARFGDTYEDGAVQISWMAYRAASLGVTAAPQEGVSGFHKPERLKAWAAAGRQIAQEELAGMSAPESPQPPRFQQTYCQRCSCKCGPGDDGPIDCGGHAKVTDDHSPEAGKMIQSLAPPPGWKLAPQPITEEMHVAAVKVLHRAHGVDGLPQRMLDAMVAAATQPPASALPDTGNVGADAWRGPFWDVARALNCLPSTFPDANAHVLREAKRFAALRCLACNGHGLIGGMTIEGGENHECPDCHGSGAALPPGRGMVPLSEDRLREIWHEPGPALTFHDLHCRFARAVERAHGIKEGSATPLGDGEGAR